MKSNQLLKVLLLLLVWLSFDTNVTAQGVTSSGIRGKITGVNNVPLTGATVEVIYVPTGAIFSNIANEKGLFTIGNLYAGGPYQVKITFVSYQTENLDEIYLKLGEFYELSAILKEASSTLQTVTVTTNTSGLNSNQTGTRTSVSKRLIANLPTVSRDLSDFTRMTPQAMITPDGGFSIAGSNTRYNSIYIDGAISNDVFGLSSQGTNGGQAGTSPISIDVIEQFNVDISPYNVTQGGFTGGNISAITRSGTNTVSGSIYYLYRNQNLAGKTPTDNPLVQRTKLPEFNFKTYGFRLGGPIIKNKLFFFVNTELLRGETPQPFNFQDYQGSLNQNDIEGLRTFLKNTYSYETGGYLDNVRSQKSDKLFLRLDWNISPKHKAMIRHSYTFGELISQNQSNNRTIQFSNNGFAFPSTTNSTAFELNSKLGENTQNKLILGNTQVHDNRGPLGTNFPFLIIRDGNAQLRLGSERFSTTNETKQNIFTITNNLTLYKNKHYITIGTHNEFYKVSNLFLREHFGNYTYRSLTDFYAQKTPQSYSRSYSLVDKGIGDVSRAAARFKAMQLGLYFQDEFTVTDKLKLSGGVRFDMPVFLGNPPTDVYFNTIAKPKMEAYYDLKGGQTGTFPSAKIAISPRLGFTYNATKDLRLRGGLGVFTGKMPLVWPAGMFANSGVLIGGVSVTNPMINGQPLVFIPDINNQYSAIDFGATDRIPSGEINIFARNLKFPQVFRTSFAIEKQLFWGLIGSIEALYSKELNNISYKNVDLLPPTVLTRGVDVRPVYTRGLIDPTYTRVILGENSNQGYSYDLTAQVSRPFRNNLMFSLAYTLGKAKSLIDATGTENASNWRGIVHNHGRNNQKVDYSLYDLGSRIVAYASYKLDVGKIASTTISLFYNGQSGRRFSYIYDPSIVQDDGTNSFDLIYIPAKASDIQFVNIMNGSTVVRTAAQQQDDMDDFINNNEYLSKYRNSYAGRNGARNPFSHVVDLKLLQDFYIKTKGKMHNIQLSLDVFNLTNLVNKSWGRKYLVGDDVFRLIRFEGFKNPSGGDYTPLYTFTKPTGTPWSINDSGTSSSRWQAQFGLRYTF